jgi:hypothetical protein
VSNKARAEAEAFVEAKASVEPAEASVEPFVEAEALMEAEPFMESAVEPAEATTVKPATVSMSLRSWTYQQSRG